MSYQIEEETEDRMTVIHDDSRWPKWFLFLALIIVVITCVNLSRHSVDREKVMGGIAAVAILGFCYLMIYEKSIFVFDRRSRTIHWTRRRVFSFREEMLSFANVKNIVAQIAPGSKRIPSQRVALITDRGITPLSISYHPDGHDACGKLAARLRDWLGLSTSDSEMDNLRGLIAGGRDMDAILFLCRRRKMTMKEAKDELKMMKEKLL